MTSQCAADECDRVPTRKGLCDGHYRQSKRGLVLRPLSIPEPWPARFWAKTERSKTGCWTWTASKNEKGYGYVFDPNSGKVRSAHRVAWELIHGPVPAGLQVLHRCDNPPCVNPDHLWTGSHADNMADMASKGRASLLRISGEDHWNAQVTSDAVESIRNDADMSGAEAARRSGLSKSQVNRIRSGEAWKMAGGAIREKRVFVPALCQVSACDRTSTRKGFCDSHYRQVRRGHEPTPLRPNYAQRADWDVKAAARRKGEP